MADHFTWIIESQSRVSGRYEGNATVQNELAPALFATFPILSALRMGSQPRA